MLRTPPIAADPIAASIQGCGSLSDVQTVHPNSTTTDFNVNDFFPFGWTCSSNPRASKDYPRLYLKYLLFVPLSHMAELNHSA